MSAEPLTTTYYVDGIRRGDRVVLSRAITVVESNRAEDRELGSAILSELSSDNPQSLRVAITGVPGSGKSTLIEELGKQYVSRGHSVAVLAIDPTSHVSGGSIMGDKTRMPKLSVSEKAYVRPSPTRGTLGGLAATTSETIQLCEAAGFDIVFIETVGVGQTEIDAYDIADLVVLILIAGAGDELQGVKRGILEIADIVVINKADGSNHTAALAARTALRSVINLMPTVRPDWNRSVLACSATEGGGLSELARIMDRFASQMRSSNYLITNRSEQQARRFDKLVSEAIRAAVGSDPGISKAVREAGDAVHVGALTPRQAASQVAEQVLRILSTRN